MRISPLYSTVFTHSVFPSKLTTTYSCKLLNISSPELLIFSEMPLLPLKKKKKNPQFLWPVSDGASSKRLFLIFPGLMLSSPSLNLIVASAPLLSDFLCLSYVYPFVSLSSWFWRRQWHTTLLAWRIPFTEEPGELQSIRSLRVGHDWATSLSLFTFMRWRRNSLQCSCLENPRDGRAWWAAVYGVAQSRTRLKRLSSSSSILISPEISN